MSLQTLTNIPLLKFNEINANDRIYSIDAGNKILDDIKARNTPMYGELGFPDRFDTSMQNVSHITENVRIVDNLLIGDIKILDTPSGRILNNSIPHYVFRTRASGHIDETTKMVTIAKFFTFDAIRREADPYNGLI